MTIHPREAYRTRSPRSKESCATCAWSPWAGSPERRERRRSSLSVSTRIEHPVELQTVAGHASVTETDADGRRGDGNSRDGVGGSSGRLVRESSVRPQRQDRLLAQRPVATGDAIHDFAIDVGRGGVPAHRDAAADRVSPTTRSGSRSAHRRCSLYQAGGRAGLREQDGHSQVQRRLQDGTTTEHVISATLSIPAAGLVQKDVTLTIVHPERIERRGGGPLTPYSAVSERAPVACIRGWLGRPVHGACAAGARACRAAGRADVRPTGDLHRDGSSELGWEWPW